MNSRASHELANRFTGGLSHVRILNLLMAAVFLFGAIVQINDPDPFLWIVIYLAAAAASYLANDRPTDIRPPAAVAAAALLWAGLIALQASGRAPFLELFAEWEMRDEVVEETREIYGLLFIAGWMLVLTVRAFRLRQAPAPADASPTPSAP
jgi:hypothetical protein